MANTQAVPDADDLSTLTGLTTATADEVAKAERVLSGLRQKRDAAVARGVALGEERTTLAFAAHADDDAKARKRLDEINREAALGDSELRSIDAAIGEATKRLAAAQAVEAREAERQRAREVLAVTERMKAAGQAIDDALAVLVAAGEDVHAAADALHMLGCPSPTGQQLLSFGERVIRGAVQKTMWSRAIERLAPGEHTSFSRVIDGWAAMIERQIGEKEEEAA
jgi:hypothetical protein